MGNIVFVGAGGTGMSGLLSMVADLGYGNIVAIDAVQSELTDKLIAQGIPVFIGHGKYAVQVDDHVIYSEACVESIEVQTAKNFRRTNKQQRLVVNYFQFLGEISKYFQTIGVMGTNGKSSTTAMLLTVAKEKNVMKNFGLGILGALVPDLGNKSYVIGNLPPLESLSADRQSLLTTRSEKASEQAESSITSPVSPPNRRGGGVKRSSSILPPLDPLLAGGAEAFKASPARRGVLSFAKDGEVNKKFQDIKNIFDYIFTGKGLDYDLVKKYIFVVEACEYKRHFLHLDLDWAILTSLELDHTDYFKDFDDYKSAFEQVLRRLRYRCFALENYGLNQQLVDEKMEIVPVQEFDFAHIFGDFQNGNASLVEGLVITSPVSPPSRRGGSVKEGENKVITELSEKDCQERGLMWDGKTLPYNPNNIEKAKKLRLNMTLAEKKVWFDILSRFDEKFYKQRPIDHFILDFYCSSCRLGIEIDGNIHDTQKDYDTMRTDLLNLYGIEIIRFSNDDVLYDTEYVYIQIKNKIETIKASPVRRGPPSIWGGEVNIKSLLENFHGLWRRMEKIVTTEKGTLVFSDYGHVASSIALGKKSLETAFPDKKLHVVFQPHQISRIVNNWEEFPEAFIGYESKIIFDIYAARESLDLVKNLGLGDLETKQDLGNVFAQHIGGEYTENFEEVKNLITSLGKDDILVIYSAGDIDYQLRKYFGI